MSTNPKDTIGMTKPALRLVPPALMLQVAQAMADGAKKYGPYNWREHPVRLTVYIEAALRHLYSLLDGEDRARDSGHHHAAHVAACMAIILDAQATGNLIDDRAADGCAADLIEELTIKPGAPETKSVGKYSGGECVVTIDGKAFGEFIGLSFSPRVVVDTQVDDEPIPFRVTEPDPFGPEPTPAWEENDLDEDNPSSGAV